nr:CYTH domain-containing protein [uncultured Haemophilus sp.]
MENEIELKIMLDEHNIVPLSQWLAQQAILEESETALGNTYFDTPEQYFAKHQMGFRVRAKNQHYEMTLKTKGEIVGGLHIRPEYNLPLTSKEPDFKRLVSHFNLQIEHAEQISANLNPTFSTDFLRHQWLIQYNQSQIEVVFDQGEVCNPFGKEKICELEFELKEGELSDIFSLIEQMPKFDRMWLSSLSKAQRGYLVGKPERFKAEILQAVENLPNYTLEQQFADYLRLSQDEEIYTLFYQKFPDFPKFALNDLQEYLKSEVYLVKNLEILKALSQKV